MNINEKTRKALLRFQQNEITESLLYTQLAAIEKDPSNKEVLLQIANDEKGHYTILKKYTGQEISPNKLRVTKYYWLARILGITFAISEKEENLIQMIADYAEIVKEAGKLYSPACVANYIYDLVKEYNQFYHDFSILREENPELKNFRLVLSANVAKIVKSGMDLLGIEVPERM